MLDTEPVMVYRRPGANWNSYLTPLVGRSTIKSRRPGLRCDSGEGAPLPISGSTNDPAQAESCTPDRRESLSEKSCLVRSEALLPGGVIR